ncbi:TPA: hypothetical protein ACH3X2_001586 [Trebouxia sp. C0005]
MAEPNEYDLQREERIRRNKAMLAKLQVQQKADDVAAPLLAALQQKEALKEAVRKKYVASGPARQSKRAGAQRTRAKLQQQAEDSADSSSEKQSVSSDAEDSEKDSQPAAWSKANRASHKRKLSAQEADFDPTDAESVEDDTEDLQLQQALTMSLEGHAGSKQKDSRTTRKAEKRKHGKVEVAAGDTQTQAPHTMPAKAKTQKKASKPRKAKATGRVGLMNPTEEEMKKAFSMFNSSNRSVISTQDISRVALEQGYNFDDEETNAMMEAAASVTGRASTTSMTFQGFQQLVAHYSRTMPT